MKLDKTELDIGAFLTQIETQEVRTIELNHIGIENNSDNLPSSISLDALPCFTVQYPGFVEVEFYLDPSCERVLSICIRQAAMTFDDMHTNGEILPTMTINCRALPSSNQERLDKLAARFISDGKLRDKARGDSLLTMYISKMMFCPRKYGGTSNA